MNRLTLLFAVAIVLNSCNLKGDNDSQSNNTSAQQYETTSAEPVQTEPTKKLTRTISVEAEVFHVINNYDGTYTDKDANRTQIIKLDVYDDGSMFMQGGDPYGGWVRYSKKDGYEYECNRTGGDVYAFN